MDIWDKRRRNLKALIAVKGTNPTSVAKSANLSVNTLGKFLRGETKSLNWSSLEKICKGLDIPNPVILDADNPFSDSKTELYDLINNMDDDQAEELLLRIKDST